MNIMLNVLHSRWTVLCGLNGVCYSEQYVEVTAQLEDNVIVAGMVCVTVNNM